MTTVAVKERPILFSTEMVRAILDRRKTQTRRPMNPQPPKDDCGEYEYGDVAPTVEWYEPVDVDSDGEQVPGPTIFGAYYDEWAIKCPFGGPGDFLWVRETFDWVAGTESISGGRKILGQRRFEHKRYKADGCPPINKKWTPSIHMPRWCSRITLEVTGVRVERIQSISAADIIAEGSVDRPHHVEGLGKCPVSSFDGGCYPDLKSLWQSRWDKIYGKGEYAWKHDPWTWVIEFKPTEPIP